MVHKQAKLILYRGTPNTPIRVYDIDGKEDVLIDLDTPGNTAVKNGYNGKLIDCLTQYGWTYHSSRSAHICDYDIAYSAPSKSKPYMFEHPTHGVATIYIDDPTYKSTRWMDGYLVGPAAHHLAEDFIRACNAICDVYD